MNRIAFFFAASVAMTGAHSQEMYKCPVDGRLVYQDKPCKGAVIVPATRPMVDEKAAIDAGKTLCREQAPKYIAWKDPDSVRVGDVFGGKERDVKVGSGGLQWGRQFFVPVNAKNSYGGYNGEKSLICNTNGDGSKILSVDSILVN